MGKPPQNYAQDLSATQPQFSSIDEFTRAQVEKQRIPGLSVSVVKNGSFLFEAAYGFADAEHHLKATTTTPFYTASVTKAFTGTSLILLEAQNKINLDRAVNDYLPAAKVHSPIWDASAATVRRVANHTAGLTTYNRKCSVEDSSCRTSTTTAIERHGILFWPPGDHFDYSNLGYGVLGAVITQASGKPFAEFLEQDILEPLRLTDCYLQTTPQLRAGSSFNYASGTHARTPVQTSDTPGASSARCSSHDLAAFGSFVLGRRLPEQRQILSSARLHELLYSDTASAGEKYSFGWDGNEIEGYRGVFAQGGTYDSFALLQLLPDQNIAIAILANTGTTLPFEIANRIVSQLLPARPSPHADRQKQKPVAGAPISGEWAGYMLIDGRSVPLSLSIDWPRKVTAMIGEKSSLCEGVKLSSTRVDCVAKSAQRASEFPSGMPDVELELYLREAGLIGAATTRGAVQLPYWVALKHKVGKR